jgi:hypothetical protein
MHPAMYGVLLFDGHAGIDGTYVGAGSAIGTELRVDNVSVVAFADGLNGTFRLTGTAHYAVIGDFVCHLSCPPFSVFAVIVQ